MKYISDYSGFKSKIRKFADDGGIEILLALIIIGCLAFIVLFLHKSSFSALFDVTFFSVIIFTALLQAVSSLFRKRIMSWSEDDVKLEPNYMKLTKRYPTIIDAQGHCHEPLLTYDNPLPNDSGASEESHTHPISHTGAQCVRLPVLFDQWLVGKDITIADHQDQQYELPHNIQEHFDELFKSHIASNIYNQLNIRVDDWDVERDSFLMSTSRTTYFDSLVTNRAMDFQWSNGLTTRDVYCNVSRHS